MHFRGPLNLKQFAFYSPSFSSTMKSRREDHAHHHAHAADYAHQHGVRNPQVGATVTATIDGIVESWINEWSGEPTTSFLPSSDSATVCSSTSAQPSSYSRVPASLDSNSNGSSASGAWMRQGYYDASSGSSQGLVFLNHHGGTGSGTFDYVFGNSLSYSTTDGCNGSAQPTILEDTILPSSAEVIIMSDNECGENNGACGYYRNGTVAYHGFKGPSKAFFYEFAMPDINGDSASEYDPVNMPAIWMLNALIPRTLQYGQSECSCWASGCGEFDLFEVLSPGDSRMKSTLHGNIAGGDSNYFSRPTSGTMKAAMILYNNRLHLKVLDNSATFDNTLDSSTLNEIISSTQTQTNGVSLFALSG